MNAPKGFELYMVKKYGPMWERDRTERRKKASKADYIAGMNTQREIDARILENFEMVTLPSQGFEVMADPLDLSKAIREAK